MATFCLPVDAPWTMLPPKKVRGNTSRALKIVVEFQPTEFFDSLTLKLPYDEDAVLFGEAMRFAEQTVRVALKK